MPLGLGTRDASYSQIGRLLALEDTVDIARPRRGIGLKPSAHAILYYGVRQLACGQPRH
jgi:hypothetical protein